jgi:hypothetical protein
MEATGIPAGLVAGWWAALGLGLLVAIVVVVLLHALRRQVKGIETAFEQAWETGKQVAQNTATTWMLADTANVAEELKQEALEHDSALGSSGA